MGLSLEGIIAAAANGDSVGVSIITNQDNGIGTFSEGSLLYKAASGGQVLGGPRFVPATLSSPALKMYISSRRLDIDPAPAGGFGVSPRQPFSANATEVLGVKITPGFGQPAMTIKLFKNSVTVPLNPIMGNLLVGVSPPFGTQHSPEAVWVVAFTEIIRPPH
jgi:hypothetical protein